MFYVSEWKNIKFRTSKTYLSRKIFLGDTEGIYQHMHTLAIDDNCAEMFFVVSLFMERILLYTEEARVLPSNKRMSRLQCPWKRKKFELLSL